MQFASELQIITLVITAVHTEQVGKIDITESKVCKTPILKALWRSHCRDGFSVSDHPEVTGEI